MSFSKLIESARDFDRVELLGALAGLRMLPENQTSVFRLDAASCASFANQHSGTQSINRNNLERFLSEELSGHSEYARMEDPAESPFTENVMFHGGNYVVFSSVDEGGVYYLQRLLEALYFSPDKQLTDLKLRLKPIVSLVLALSDLAASRAQIPRWVKGTDRCWEPIVVPEDEDFKRIVNAATFSVSGVEALAKRFDGTIDSLEPFLVDDDQSNFQTVDPFCHPLLFKPFLRDEERVVLVAPTSINCSLRSFIWSEAQRASLVEPLIKAYRTGAQIDLVHAAKMMVWQPLNDFLPSPELSECISEHVFQIDNDKTVLIHMLCDDLRNYEAESLLSMADFKTEGSLIEARQAEAIKIIKERIETKVFSLVVIEGIGRGFLFGLNEIEGSEQQMLLGGYELQILSAIPEIDNLTLYKFEKLKELVTKEIGIFDSSFLNTFGFYWERNRSFYPGDDSPPNSISLLPGFQHDITHKALSRLDLHLVEYFEGNKFRKVASRYGNPAIPISFVFKKFGFINEQVVECYEHPIWIKCGETFEGKDHLARETVDCLAYWVWQLGKSVADQINDIMYAPLHIEINSNGDELIQKDLSDDIDIEETSDAVDVTVCGSKLVLTLNEHFWTLMQHKDNHGERVLVLQLMEAFNELSKNSEGELLFTEEQKIEIQNQIILVGQKRKMAVSDLRTRPALIPFYLPRLRRVCSHDIDLQLSSLLAQIDELDPDNHGPLSQETSERITKAVVAEFFSIFKERISKFEASELLHRAIGQNEASLHMRQMEQETRLRSIECFGNRDADVKRLANDIPRSHSTSIASRWIAEFVVAEPPSGSSQISDGDWDELMSLAHLTCSWGITSDEVYCNLRDHPLAVLPSGRIGVDGGRHIGHDYQYMCRKISEEVDGVSATDEICIDGKPLLESESCKKAFVAEFGLEPGEVVEFLYGLVWLGFEQATPCQEFEEGALLSELKDRLPSWSSSEIERALTIFSTVERKDWQDLPKGYYSKERFPWRVGRELSYLRKPILRVNVDGKAVYCFGFRNVSMACNHLLGIITQGTYSSSHCTSEMQSFMGKVGNLKGRVFNKRVYEFLDNNIQWELHSEVVIGPNGALTAPETIGDIDILGIDEKEKVLYLIESKAVVASNDSFDLKNEFDKLVGADTGDKSWIDQKAAIHKWVSENLTALEALHQTDFKDFEIKGFVVTSVDLPIRYLKQIDLTVIPFIELASKGESAFC